MIRSQEGHNWVQPFFLIVAVPHARAAPRAVSRSARAVGTHPTVTVVTFTNQMEKVRSNAALHLYASVEQNALTRKWHGFRQSVINLGLFMNI